MRKFVLAAFLAWLTFSFTVLGAPAPKSKRDGRHKEAYPGRFLGYWTLYYFNDHYLYRFDPNGKYKHIKTGDVNMPDYSGEWKYENNVLYVYEYSYGSLIIEYEFVFEGGYWKAKKPDPVSFEICLRR